MRWIRIINEKLIGLPLFQVGTEAEAATLTEP